MDPISTLELLKREQILTRQRKIEKNLLPRNQKSYLRMIQLKTYHLALKSLYWQQRNQKQRHQTKRNHSTHLIKTSLEIENKFTFTKTKQNYYTTTKISIYTTHVIYYTLQHYLLYIIQYYLLYIKCAPILRRIFLMTNSNYTSKIRVKKFRG